MIRIHRCVGREAFSRRTKIAAAQINVIIKMAASANDSAGLEKELRGAVVGALVEYDQGAGVGIDLARFCSCV